MKTNAYLWSKFLLGDNRALGELYEHLFEPLVFVSYYFVKNNDTARDIVSELFVHLLSSSVENRQQKWQSIEDIHFYLNKMIRNKSIDHLRKTQNQHRILKGIDFPTVHSIEVFPNEMLNELPDQEREIIGLHLDGFNNHELADRFHLSEKTIRNKLSLSRKKMLRYFKTVLILFS